MSVVTNPSSLPKSRSFSLDLVFAERTNDEWLISRFESQADALEYLAFNDGLAEKHPDPIANVTIDLYCPEVADVAAQAIAHALNRPFSVMKKIGENDDS